MSWDSESLWQKAKLYTQRAQREDRDTDTFALWSTLALEFLARASLANVHPALLADHRNPENIMYAFDLTKTGRSVQAETVFRRLQRVVPNFTESESRQCMALIDRRNAELHSGESGFADYPQQQWLAQYYRSCDLMCQWIGQDLQALFGDDEARAARTMIQALETRVVDDVKSVIKRMRAVYEELDEPARAMRRQQNEVRFHLTVLDPSRKAIRCPACQQGAFLTGETIHQGDPRAEDDEIVIDAVLLPTRLQCAHCGLALGTHAEVRAAGYGDQFSITERYDPVDYFNIDIEAAHDFGDYDNE